MRLAGLDWFFTILSANGCFPIKSRPDNPRDEAAANQARTMSKGLLEEALRVLTIRDAWVRRGWHGTPGRSCHFPNCPDGSKKASCSIFPANVGKHVGCELLKDHKENKVYDLPGLIAAVEGVTNAEACRIVIDMAGVKPLDDGAAKKSKSARKPQPPPPPSPLPPPPFDCRVLDPVELSGDDVCQLARREQRGGAMGCDVGMSSLRHPLAGVALADSE